MATDAVAYPRRRSAIARKQLLFNVIVLAILLSLVLVFFVPRDWQRAINEGVRGWRGGSLAGMFLAYVGALALTAAQFYTVVKRIGVPSLVGTMGGASLWLNVHIALSLTGVLAGLLHSGFPFRFPYAEPFDKGFAALTTWVLVVVTGSGVFGRYLWKHLSAMRRPFRFWKIFHIAATVSLFGLGIAHVILA